MNRCVSVLLAVTLLLGGGVVIGGDPTVKADIIGWGINRNTQRCVNQSPAHDPNQPHVYYGCQPGWWQQTIVYVGVGAGCSFIGAGAGMASANPLVGTLVGIGCDAAIST